MIAAGAESMRLRGSERSEPSSLRGHNFWLEATHNVEKLSSFAPADPVHDENVFEILDDSIELSFGD